MKIIVSVSIIAGAVGTATAFFLWALDWVTRWQWQHPEFLWGLPVAGFLMASLYQRWGQGSELGTAWLLEEIRSPATGVPGRMGPLVLFSTLVTHLCGGSAGREGTAVQMGGSLASFFSGFFNIDMKITKPLLIRCGLAAGFGAVFGTPWAGAVFALEVLWVSQPRWYALPCVLSTGLLADLVCRAWGCEHLDYHFATASLPTPDFGNGLFWGKVALAGIGFGLAARLYKALLAGISSNCAKWVRRPVLRPVLGGGVVILMAWLLDSRDFLGLGVLAPPGGQDSIWAALQPTGVAETCWFWKCLFTAVTLGTGFKGGEVTPLFFIGASLGCTLGGHLQVPVSLFASLGFVSVFAGAGKTPWAGTILAVELFGISYLPFFGATCLLASWASGGQSIYSPRNIIINRTTKK